MYFYCISNSSQRIMRNAAGLHCTAAATYRTTHQLRIIKDNLFLFIYSFSGKIEQFLKQTNK